jgi:hypothetical protein
MAATLFVPRAVKTAHNLGSGPRKQEASTIARLQNDDNKEDALEKAVASAHGKRQKVLKHLLAQAQKKLNKDVKKAVKTFGSDFGFAE